MTLVKSLNLNGNPFEHYTAETEPNIAAYAVRPPYLQAISDRANGLSSFILFGDRGAGKSATRITVYNEVWKNSSEAKNLGKRQPLVVNLTDFSLIQENFTKNRLTDIDIVRIATFAVIEQVLVWLSSLEESDRNIYIDGLDKNERTIVFALIKGFYLSTPELERELSTTDALRLLNSAWTTKSSIWISSHWSALSSVIANLVNAFSKNNISDSVDISAPAEALLKSLIGEAPNTSRALLGKTVEFVKAFGFSGVCVLVDKVDETPSTADSSEATARLIYPLLSHIQLLEVSGFSWVLFLWSNVQDNFNEKHPVRLDKIAHANITWDLDSLRIMLDSRIKYFSQGRLMFADILNKSLDVDTVFKELGSMALRSPRELIKLLDIIFREHDARGVSDGDLLDRSSLDLGQDKYAKETIGNWFTNKLLQQVLRLGKTNFVNKDVQFAFKIGDQGARVKIKNWVDAGIVRQSGTAPSELGGKPVYLFVIADSRVERIIERKLDDVVGAELLESDLE